MLGPHVSIGALASALAMTGVGFGLTLVAVTELVLSLVPPERSGMGASTLNTSRQLGGVFGVAVLGALVNAQLTTNLRDQLAHLGIPPTFQGIVINAVTHGGLPASPAGVSNPAAAGHQTIVAKVLQAADDAFGSGLHLSLIIAGAMLLAAAVAGFVLTTGSPAAASARTARAHW